MFSSTKIKLLLMLKALIYFLLALVVLYGVHSYLFEVRVVFYSALLDAFIAAILVVLYIFFASESASINFFEKLQMSVILILLGYAFAISIPTVIDRSLSFYILEKIDQRGGGVLKDSLEGIVINEYMNEHQLVDVRITEQLESGTVELINGCLKLTDRGRLVVAASLFIRKNFLPKKRLIIDRYSSDLTSPFELSPPKVDYVCQ